MRNPISSHLAGALAVAGLAITPAAAHALPSLTTDRACYAADADPMVLTGAGFSPDAAIALMFTANGQVGGYDATADSSGAFTATVTAPKLSMFKVTKPSFTLDITANDQSKLSPTGPIAPAEETFAATAVTITDWYVKASAWAAKTAARGKRVTLTAKGWASAGDALYIHYFRGSKAVNDERLGALSGPCGDLKVTTKAFSFKSAKPGNYKVRISGDPVWTADHRWYEFRVRLK